MVVKTKKTSVERRELLVRHDAHGEIVKRINVDGMSDAKIVKVVAGLLRNMSPRYWVDDSLLKTGISPTTIARPFVKMAGGKTKLLPDLLTLVPKNYGNYYEPFVGGGALFFALREQDAIRGDARHYTLGDMNFDLITTYRQIREAPDDLIERLKKMKNTEKNFLRVRAFDMDSIPDGEPGKGSTRAARFIFLNKTCFNGLHRVNRQGQFNVPFGRYDNPKICDEPNLRSVSRALKNTTIIWAQFYQVVMSAVKGDLVYFDPPYMPISATSNFTGYGSGGFGWVDHVALYQTARALKKRGVRVILSNSNNPRIRELYAKGFKVHEVQAARSINATATGRGKITELVFT